MNDKAEQSRKILELRKTWWDLYCDYLEGRGNFARRKSKRVAGLVAGEIYDLVVDEVRNNIKKRQQKTSTGLRKRVFEFFTDVKPGDYIYDDI